MTAPRNQPTNQRRATRHGANMIPYAFHDETRPGYVICPLCSARVREGRRKDHESADSTGYAAHYARHTPEQRAAFDAAEAERCAAIRGRS